MKYPFIPFLQSHHRDHNRDQEAGEQNRSDAPPNVNIDLKNQFSIDLIYSTVPLQKRDLAFSVYLREMKSEPGETGGQRGEEEEEEDDDEEMNEEDEEDEDVGLFRNPLILPTSQKH